MKKILFLVMIPMIVLVACQVKNPVAQAEARTVIEAWLGNLDDNGYEKAYGEMSDYFKNNIELKNFLNKMKGVHAPFGQTVNRKMKKATYRTTIEGAPDGEYVTIVFKTGFKSKSKAIESVTAMKEKGVWKVTGYFIK